MIEDSEKDVEQNEEKPDRYIKAHSMEINEAENWLADSMAPMAQAPSSLEVWSQFKPQQNQEPIHLEQGVTHLEVTKFLLSFSILELIEIQLIFIFIFL